jgi:hypothetical protein
VTVIAHRELECWAMVIALTVVCVAKKSQASPNFTELVGGITWIRKDNCEYPLSG